MKKIYNIKIKFKQSMYLKLVNIWKENQEFLVRAESIRRLKQNYLKYASNSYRR